MAKGIDSKDSLRSCDLYSNPYDARLQSHPALIKQRAQRFDPKDTMTCAQAKLEKDIFQRLQSLPLGKLMIIGQIGKYLFLAIVLPPYIFCYGIPKWLLTEGLPKVYDVTTRIVRRISDKISDVAHRGINALKTLGHMITSPILMYIQTQIEKAQELFAYLKNATLYAAGYPYRLFDQKVIQPLSNLLNQLKDGIEKLSEGYQNLMQRLNQFQQDIRNFFLFLPNKLKDNAEALFNLIQNKFGEMSAPFLSFANLMKNNAYKAYDYLNNKLEAMLDRFFYSPLQKIKNFGGAAKDKAIQIFESIAQPVVQWFDPKLEAIKKGLEAARNKLNSIKDRTKDRLKNKAKEIWDTVSDRVDVAAKFIGKAAGIVGHELLQMIPQPVISLFTPAILFMREKFGHKKVAGVTKTWMKKVKKKFHSGLQQAFEWIQRVQDFSTKVIKRVFVALKKVPMKMYHLLKLILSFIVTAMKGTFLIIRLMFAWFKAFIRYGMLLVRDATRQILYPERT
jgi:predicted PurR-regulated permease PerM